MIQPSAVSSQRELKKYQWKNRVILLNPNTEDSARSRRFLEALSYQLEELRQRRVEILIWQGRSEIPFFQLIGLDGGVKMRSESAPVLGDVLKKIDSMPMRHQEARRTPNLNTRPSPPTILPNSHH